MNTARRIPGVWSTKRPFGPNGEKLCYNCLGPLPKGRPYNCSAKCSDDWRCKTSPSFMRAKLLQRDKGACSECAVDTLELKRQYNSLAGKSGRRSDSYGITDEQRIAQRVFRETHGIPLGRAYGDFWDADHITPVIEGGGACGLDNYRTLCIPCHRKATKELHGRLKKRQVEKKLLPLLAALSTELAGTKATAAPSGSDKL